MTICLFLSLLTFFMSFNLAVDIKKTQSLLNNIYIPYYLKKINKYINKYINTYIYHFII